MRGNAAPMAIALTILITTLLVGATVLIHYEALSLAGSLMRRLPIRPRRRILVAILVCMGAHVTQVTLYAAAYAVLHDAPGMGRLEGAFEADALGFFYFSATSFTTLGVGDVFPHGPIRLIAAIEALNGFLLVTWSASFSYLIMRRWWHADED
jgi:hypothetical protein